MTLRPEGKVILETGTVEVILHHGSQEHGEGRAVIS